MLNCCSYILIINVNFNEASTEEISILDRELVLLFK
jgi:hypothetical protein